MKKKYIAVTLVLCLILCCCGCSDRSSGISDELKEPKNNDPTALIINNRHISAVEMNYFYIDTIEQFVGQYGNWIGYILDTSSPLSEQTYDKTTGATWADYFLETAIDSVKNTYALYDAAKAANHTLSAEEQALIQSLSDDLTDYAKYYNYSNADDYLISVYGDSANISTYQSYYEVMITVSSYYAAYTEQLRTGYTDENLRDFEKGKEYAYNSYSYATYFLNISDFENSTSSEEAAKKLANSEYNTVQKLNSAIASLGTELGNDMIASSQATEVNNILYNEIDSQLQEWIRDTDREEGNITFLEYRSSNSNEITGYYVVLYIGSNDNQYPLANVRHILAKFAGSTDADKAAAKEEAEKIYDEWLTGEKTEDSFAALAKKYTDDGNGDVGGLYEDIYPGQMVNTFNDWCFDETRNPGDHGIVVTEYGYHIMYYSGHSDTTYRNFMVSNDKLSADLNAWQTELFKSAQLEVVNTSNVNLDHTISAS